MNVMIDGAKAEPTICQSRKSTSGVDPSKAEGGEIAAALPSGYSRGEGQKPVSKAYKDNWNVAAGILFFGLRVRNGLNHTTPGASLSFSADLLLNVKCLANYPPVAVDAQKGQIIHEYIFVDPDPDLRDRLISGGKIDHENVFLAGGGQGLR